jgi:hypothetical protein
MIRKMRALPIAVIALLFLCAGASPVAAQNRALKKLSASDIIKRYLRAVGDEKSLKAVQSASYRGTISGGGDGAGRFTLETQSPNRIFLELAFDANRRVDAVNGASAWSATTREGASTVTDEAARLRKIEAVLLADRRLDLKKSMLAARSLPTSEINGTPCYVVDFAFAQLRAATVTMHFDAKTFLPVRVESGTGELRRRFDFSDFRPVDGVQEPHRIHFQRGESAPLTLTAEQVSHNVALAANRFDPPTSDATVNIEEILLAVITNQKKVEDEVANYTYMLKETSRELDKNGQVKETEVKEYEVYPLEGGTVVRKLVRVDGRTLSASDAEKEQKRVTKAIEENEKRRQKKKGDGGDEDERENRLGISDFLRANEFYNPRREFFRGRDAIVCDFRPRKNFKAQSREEEIANKLSGIMWIDAADRRVARLEGRLDDGFRVAGGLVSIKRGSAFSFEQTRVAEGVWLPLRRELNGGAKAFLFLGLNVSVESQYSEYKRFTVTTTVQDDNAPERQ